MKVRKETLAWIGLLLSMFGAVLIAVSNISALYYTISIVLFVVSLRVLLNGKLFSVKIKRKNSVKNVNWFIGVVWLLSVLLALLTAWIAICFKWWAIIPAIVLLTCLIVYTNKRGKIKWLADVALVLIILLIGVATIVRLNGKNQIVEKQVVKQQIVETQEVKEQNTELQQVVEQDVENQRVTNQEVETQKVTVQNVEKQNVVTQNVETQNVVTQNVEKQNVVTQNVKSQKVENVQSKPTEAVKVKDTQSKPVETQKEEAKPVETQKEEAKPVETQKEEAKPVEVSIKCPEIIRYKETIYVDFVGIKASNILLSNKALLDYVIISDSRMQITLIKNVDTYITLTDKLTGTTVTIDTIP